MRARARECMYVCVCVCVHVCVRVYVWVRVLGLVCVGRVVLRLTRLSAAIVPLFHHN